MKLQPKPIEALGHNAYKDGVMDLRKWRRQINAIVKRYGLGPMANAHDSAEAHRKLRLKLRSVTHRKINHR